MQVSRPTKGSDDGKATDQSALFGIEDPLDPIADMSVRVVSLNDIARTGRDAWLAQVFAQAAPYAFDDEDTRCVSLAFDDYDALVLSGNDATRMIRFIRINRRIVGRKIKLCVMSESQPRRRAALLAAGFDDVFDTGRQDQQEAIARIRAVQRRYLNVREVEARATDRQDRLTALVEPHHLTPREADILAILLESPSHFAKYSTLITRLSTPKRMISMENLKVSVSKIRMKLQKGTTHYAHHKAGYKLTLADASHAAEGAPRPGQRAPRRAALNRDLAEQPVFPEGYIRHDGTDCPVPLTSKPGVILRRGDRFEQGEVTAGSWDWDHLGDGSDVLAYKPEATPR